MRARDLTDVHTNRDRESGQAMVEFALILFPLLLIVAGIIQFGIALNYWLDMQRIANQGARWAAVNCTRSATTPPSYNPCSPNLQTTLRQQALANGLKQSVCVAISFPSGSALKGDPVKVSLKTPFTLLPILGVGKLDLGADATMRMEWTPTAFSSTAAVSMTRATGARERGQVVVVFALMIPVLFALGAIVLDIGNWYVHKRHLQTQVDAAVLAAGPAFVGCFHAPAAANQAIAQTALQYAGDTLRVGTTVNKQVEQPNDVRVALNSSRYWNKSDGTTSPVNGYGLDNTMSTPGDPCTTKMLDAKATDDDAPSLWGLIPLTPSPKTHAKVEIRKVESENGMLPWAVPEIDPRVLYALFVNEDNGAVFDSQKLRPSGRPEPSVVGVGNGSRRHEREPRGARRHPYERGRRDPHQQGQPDADRHRVHSPRFAVSRRTSSTATRAIRRRAERPSSMPTTVAAERSRTRSSARSSSVQSDAIPSSTSRRPGSR